MQKISVTVTQEHIELLEDVDENRSEAVRTVFDEYQELRERVDDLEDELKHQEARAEDLRRQLQEVTGRDEDVQELARYVEEEREVERRYREASVVTRARWWLTGMDIEDDRRRRRRDE